MGMAWLTDGLVGMTQESTTTQHSAILHEDANKRIGLWKLISQGILTNLMQFETVGHREGS